MKRVFCCAAVVLLLTCARMAPLWADYTETWSRDGNTEGWGGAAGSVTHDDAADALQWNGNPQGSGFGPGIYANAGASGGHFAGDLSRYGYLRFDLRLDPGAPVPADIVVLLYGPETSPWTYILPLLPVQGTWYTYTVPLDPAATGWRHQGGSWDTLIHAVRSQYVWANYYSGVPGVSGLLDNFTIGTEVTDVPEPGSLALGLLALGGWGLARRRKRRA